MRPKVPANAAGGVGIVPRGAGQTLAGLAEFSATVVGGSGRTSIIKARSVVVDQVDTNTHALTLTSAGSSYTANLLVARDSTGTTVTTINNSGRLNLNSFTNISEISSPSTPAANTLSLYAADSGGVATLFYKDDAGVEHNLAIGGLSTGSSPYAAYAKYGID